MLTSATALMECGSSSQPYHATLKGTFIHMVRAVNEITAGTDLRRRSQSAPPPSTSASPCSVGTATASYLSYLNHILFGDDEGQTCGLSGETEDRGRDHANPGADDGGRGEPSRRSCRPPRSERIRYAKLVTRLETAIVNDPVGFDMGSVPLPKKVRKNPKLQGKLKARLTRFRDAEMQRRAQAQEADVGRH
mmetsp:Transcript_41693/g.116173  ORF Transcript_41693/g.116173 Transcript_41693/m.116173 type:complete len:192 (-) Transcript_41693:153-728(-)